jgi:hypothetical protein
MRYCIVLILIFFVAACDVETSSSKGFTLPEGDAENGKTVFFKYRCTDCHYIASESTSEKPNSTNDYLTVKPIMLGGTEGNVKTYGELVTSIINPSHKIAPRYPASFTSSNGLSKMRMINDELTVAELIDLVAYLQAQYKVAPYRTSDYRLYKLRTKSEGD